MEPKFETRLPLFLETNYCLAELEKPKIGGNERTQKFFSFFFFYFQNM